VIPPPLADEPVAALAAAAASIGLLHTLAGPDHYVPFIAMARAGRWSGRKTVTVTLLCGLGHVLGSLLLALGAVALGRSLEGAVAGVTGLADVRAGLATWLLIGFGGVYAAWGLKQAARGRVHAHVHAHADGTVHLHPHAHEEPAHLHAHGVAAAPGVAGAEPRRRTLTPWLLFAIFLFGPCEPLLPLVLAPELAGQSAAFLPIVLAFTAATLAAMLACVAIGLRSAALLDRPRFAGLARFQHALAGLLVLGCGVAMKYGL